MMQLFSNYPTNVCLSDIPNVNPFRFHIKLEKINLLLLLKGLYSCYLVSIYFLIVKTYDNHHIVEKSFLFNETYYYFMVLYLKNIKRVNFKEL